MDSALSDANLIRAVCILQIGLAILDNQDIGTSIKGVDTILGQGLGSFILTIHPYSYNCSLFLSSQKKEKGKGEQEKEQYDHKVNDSLLFHHAKA